MVGQDHGGRIAGIGAVTFADHLRADGVVVRWESRGRADRLPAARRARRVAGQLTVTVFSTVGFGDITAKSEAARVVLIVQMLADLAFLGAGIRVLVGAVQRGRAQRSDTGDDTGPAAR